MRFPVVLVLLTIAAGSGAPAPLPDRAAASGISAARIRADIEFLADDLLEGRETGTRGYDIAARFAATALQAAGYEPAADDGTYFQQVPLLESTLTSANLALTTDGDSQQMRLPDEAIVMPSATESSVDITAPVVFAGYGVTAPEHGYDDYAGLDVKGKVAAVLFNAPASFPSEPRAYYGASDQKLRSAAHHGAIAVLTLLPDEALRRFPWERLKMRAAQPSITWANPDGSAGPTERRIRATAYLNPAGAARLFGGAPMSFGDAAREAAAGRAKGLQLAATVTIATRSRHARTSSANVIGRLPGRDPQLEATSLILSAHLDHVGMLPAGPGDRINNGAYDNATGSAILLEVARVLATQPDRPRRSVVVSLLTGEEKGLVGSDYLARHPPARAGRLVADVNLDMPVFMAASTDIVAFGAEHSSLEAVVRSTASGSGTCVPWSTTPTRS